MSNRATESGYSSHPNSSALVAVLILCALIQSAHAELEYGVDVDLGVIRSDNVFIAPAGEEQSETVYTIVPQFYLTFDAERLQVDFLYRPEVYFFSEFDNSNDIFHILDADLTVALVRDRLFLNVLAMNYQTILTPDERIPSGNLPITSNRIDSRTLQARPYWRQRIGQVDLLIEASYVDIEYDDPQLQSSNERHAYTSLGNIERQQGLAWQVNYRFRRTEYEVAIPWEFQRAALDLGVWVNGVTRLFAVGGVETSFDNIFEPNMDSDFWEAGFQYTPNRRLNLELAAGDRSYGSSFRGDLSYEGRRSNISFNYDEGPGTRGDLVFELRPIIDEDELDGILDRPGASDRFVRKYGQFRVGFEFKKSDLDLRFFSERRELRTTAEGDPLGDEEYSGITFRWNWRAGAKTTLGIGADLGVRDQSGVEDEFRRGLVSLAYQLSQRLRFRLETARFEQEGRQSSALDYTENQYRTYLTTRL